MSFKKKIEFDRVENKAVEVARTESSRIRFLIESNDYKARKRMKVDIKGMAEMVSTLQGSMIEQGINFLILEHIILEYGTKKQLEAYNEFQEKSGKAVKAYFEELVCINNAEKKSDKKSV